METLYLASPEARVGKSLLAAAMGRRAADRGRRVGYLKLAGPEADSDSALVQRALGLPAASPLLGGRESDAPLTAEERQRLRSYLERAARETDLLLVEGWANLASGGSALREVVEALDARLLLILWYTEEMDGSAAQSVAAVRDRLAGVLVNGVPPLRLRHAREALVPRLAAQGLTVLGLLPQDRLLRAPTVREIARHLEGEIPYYPEKAEALVEHVMVGALALDGGLYYFGQRENKLVVTRWDRPDLQNAALETSTRGLLLTGGRGPIPYMEARVREKEVPVVVVQEGTIATALKLSSFSSRGALHPDKVRRAGDLLDAHGGLGALL